ncbi:hypothetical protein P9112_008187 [Eukaryota sp. TZLM1-RC]
MSQTEADILAEIESVKWALTGDELEAKLKELHQQLDQLKASPPSKSEPPKEAPKSQPSTSAPKIQQQISTKSTTPTQSKPSTSPTDSSKAVAASKTAPISEDQKKVLLDDIIKRRFLYAPAFEIYGGVSGLYDYGPVLAGVKRNVINLWVDSFITGEPDIYEIATTALTPENVFKASGHVEKFCDLMVRDVVTKQTYRADQLLEAHLAVLLEDPKLTNEEKEEINHAISTADALTPEEMDEAIKKYKVKSPVKNDLSESAPMNLMFETFIGPLGQQRGFLRPETAQGIFVNFPRLFEFNNKQLPFGVAQIGTSFRNEISPRAGILRLREFSMAEIEYFIKPDEIFHNYIDDVGEVEIQILPRELQEEHGASAEGFVLNIYETIDAGYIETEVLGYFIGKVVDFLHNVGIDPSRIRFRQHLSSQMAHYAKDCWDAEVLLSTGWTEVVGIADRSCYDLTCHATGAKVDMTAEIQLKEPVVREVVKFEFNKKVCGKKFKGDLKLLESLFSEMSNEKLGQLMSEMEEKGVISVTVARPNGEEITLEINKNELTLSSVVEKQYVEKIVPRVIEPSFGIDRIVYSILEHTMYLRPGATGATGTVERTVFNFPPIIAPYKVALFPLFNKTEFEEYCANVAPLLQYNGISFRTDSSGAIGRRYARADEIGIPFGITVDHESLTNNHLTVRERDSGEQISVHYDRLADVLGELLEGGSWKDVKKAHKVVKSSI